MADQDIRELIARFLDGELPAAELEDRVESCAWDLDGGPAAELAGNVLRVIAEYDNGDWTDLDLRELLGSISRTYWFDQAPKVAIVASASNVTLETLGSGSADRRLVTARA